MLWSLSTLQSENEETVTVYQRPAGLSLEVPEDIDGFSTGDDGPEVGWLT